MIFDKLVTIPLQKPLKWEGKTISEVNLDFSQVNGKTLIDTERKMNRLGNFVLVAGLSPDYCAHVAAELSGVPVKALEKLNLCDFNPVWQAVSAYLNNRDPQRFYDQYIADPDGGDDILSITGSGESDKDTGFTQAAETN